MSVRDGVVTRVVVLTAREHDWVNATHIDGPAVEIYVAVRRDGEGERAACNREYETAPTARPLGLMHPRVDIELVRGAEDPPGVRRVLCARLKPVDPPPRSTAEFTVARVTCRAAKECR